MEASVDISKKRTVSYSLAAPEKMAIRKSGNNEKQTYRSKFMRDRDRILYSKAFRRLAGKTQVYLTGVDDHKRTRLTHTLEVSQIAKTIASNLLLNVDLTEAIALGHDIGHTPYGHSGERTLHEIMVPHLKNEIIDCPLKCEAEETNFDYLLGFKHNLQSVQTAIVSERYYQNYGLDLTNFTLFGLMFHSSENYDEGKTIKPKKLGCYDKYKEYYYISNSKHIAWSFEAFVVREADEIAQRHHDLEDAIRGSLITKKEACNILMEYFRHFLKPKDRKIIRQLASNNDEYFISNISRIIVNLLVNKLIESSIFNMNQLIEQENLKVNNFPSFIISHSPEDDKIRNIINYEKIGMEDGFLNKIDEFKKRISEIVLASYEIQTADAKGRYIITKLFQAFYKNPQQLPNHCIEEYLLETYAYKSQSDLQEDINKFGIGNIRKKFMKVINDDKKYGDKEKVILMRVICNYIAGMTDNYALKMYQELYI